MQKSQKEVPDTYSLLLNSHCHNYYLPWTHKGSSMPSNSNLSHNKRRIRPLSSGFLNIFIVLSGNHDSTAEPILFETSQLWKPSNHLFPPTRKLFIYTFASQVKSLWHCEIFIVLCSDGLYFWNWRGIYATCLCLSYSIILLPSQLLYCYTIFQRF